MFKEKYKVGDIRYGSPLIEADIYDAFRVFFIGIAVESTTGVKYVITKKVFDETKKKFEDKYYSGAWKIIN